MPCHAGRGWDLLTLLTFLLGLASPVEAQKTSLPASTVAASKDQAVIARQLQLASQLGKRCLAELQATSPDDPSRVDDSIVQKARDTYVLIRAARHGMELQAESQKFADPFRELVFQRVDAAWNLSRTAVDKYNSAPSRADYLPAAIRDLGEAMRLLDQALILMP